MFVKLKEKLSTKSIQALDTTAEQLATAQTKYDTAFDEMIARMLNPLARVDMPELQRVVDQVFASRKALGIYGFGALSHRMLRRIKKWIQDAPVQDIHQMAHALAAWRALQAEILMHSAMDPEVPVKARQLRAMHSLMVARVSGPIERKIVVASNQLVSGIVTFVNRVVMPIGFAAEKVAGVLQSSTSIWTGGKVARGLGLFIEAFFSRDALANTGFETSWGFRVFPPGSFGFLANGGPWMMLYTGTLRQYQAQAVPFRVNPGATLALDILTLTQNRPGFGMGSALPVGSAYLDRARYKLLVGRDGVAYIRIGEWEGRGPYFTISAFIPLTPFMNITWNASIFSPGFKPLVVWSTPVARWLRGVSDAVFSRLTAPFRTVWRIMTRKG